MAVAGFPNLFFTYGPQAPTAFCNGPTCAQLQGTWIRNALLHLRAQSLLRIEAQAASEARWTDEVRRLAGATLMTGVDSVSLIPGSGLRLKCLFLSCLMSLSFLFIFEMESNGMEWDVPELTCVIVVHGE